MTTCDYCQHVEMCGWRKELEEQGCDFFDDGDKWIPVSERLPEKNGYYIVSLNDAVDPCASFDNGKWYYVAFECVSKEYREHEVIAWQPLPEPYKGGDTE